MMLQEEFLVARPRERVATDLDDDRTIEKLFPDTVLEHTVEGARETRTPYTALGQTRDVRFVFQTLPDGNIRFDKICDGNVWRALSGRVEVEAVDAGTTRVIITMEGRTRAFVPEVTIRAPMREQMRQMARSLRDQLETA